MNNKKTVRLHGRHFLGDDKFKLANFNSKPNCNTDHKKADISKCPLSAIRCSNTFFKEVKSDLPKLT